MIETRWEYENGRAVLCSGPEDELATYLPPELIYPTIDRKYHIMVVAELDSKPEQTFTLEEIKLLRAYCDRVKSCRM